MELTLLHPNLLFAAPSQVAPDRFSKGKTCGGADKLEANLGQ